MTKPDDPLIMKHPQSNVARLSYVDIKGNPVYIGKSGKRYNADGSAYREIGEKEDHA